MKRILLITALEYSGKDSYFDKYLLSILPSKGYNYLILSFLRLKDYFRYRCNEVNGIKVIRIPVLFPLRSKNFYISIFYILPFILNALPCLIISYFFYSPSFIHFRNYPAGLLVILLKKIFGVKYIGTLPGKYPEEGIASGIWSKNSFSYRIWKVIEKIIIKWADYILVVSEPHLREIRKMGKVEFIPPAVDISRFYPSNEKKIYTLCHLGTFSSENDIENIKNLMKHLVEINVYPKILILTSYFHKRLREKLGELLKYAEIDYIPHWKVPEYLRKCKIGLLLESKNPGIEVSISAKIGEYLASGLPVIISPYSAGAKIVIEKYKCGVVYSVEQTDVDTLKKFLDNLKYFSKNARRGALEYLSIDKYRKRMEEIYKQLA